MVNKYSWLDEKARQEMFDYDLGCEIELYDPFQTPWQYGCRKDDCLFDVSLQEVKNEIKREKESYVSKLRDFRGCVVRGGLVNPR